MGRASKAKGARRERELARLTGGTRVPLSGAAPGLPGDVVLRNGLRCEVKARKDGWATLRRWLERADVPCLRADRRPWLVVLPLERFLALVEGKDGT